MCSGWGSRRTWSPPTWPRRRSRTADTGRTGPSPRSGGLDLRVNRVATDSGDVHATPVPAGTTVTLPDLVECSAGVHTASMLSRRAPRSASAQHPGSAAPWAEHPRARCASPRRGDSTRRSSTASGRPPACARRWSRRVHQLLGQRDLALDGGQVAVDIYAPLPGVLIHLLEPPAPRSRRLARLAR
jgi:hypothetical protein